MPQNIDKAFHLVIPFLHNRDRSSVSLVCRRFYQIEAMTREHVKIPVCYSAKPAYLRKRFPNLKSVIILNSRPKDLFSVIPQNWGGIAKPWVDEFSTWYNLKSLSVGRMFITDDDLNTLPKSKLEVLILKLCRGFSTDGLLHIATNCRNLKTLSLQDSVIMEKDGKWLHEMSLNNNVLENLNFYRSRLYKVNFKDLQVIGIKCKNLISVKINKCDVLDLINFLKEAKNLEEFVGGPFHSLTLYEDEAREQLKRYSGLIFPRKLHQLELFYLGNDEMVLLYPIAARLKKLDLSNAVLDPRAYWNVLALCHNLESLQSRNIIGDVGLQAVARYCKKLKRVTIEHSADDGKLLTVSHRGLIALARECTELEHLTIYVYDITNEALECVGTNLKNLVSFTLFLIDDEQDIMDFPLDTGVCSLLSGCQKLRRFGLYLREGGLSDIGLKNIGKLSTNIRSMLLGFLGESDEGLLDFSRGCPNLEKLKLRGWGLFSEQAIATAVLNLKSLKYLWVQGYMESENGHGLLAMARPYWNIELIPVRRAVEYDTDGEEVYVTGPNGEEVYNSMQIVAYYSLAGSRTDLPEDTVVSLITDGPPRFEGERPEFGDREGYCGGPQGAPGEFADEKGGAPADYQPAFGGSGERPGFGRGAGGFGSGGPGAGGAAPPSSSFS